MRLGFAKYREDQQNLFERRRNEDGFSNAHLHDESALRCGSDVITPFEMLLWSSSPKRPGTKEPA